MPPKVNYAFQKAERERAKQAKKEARAQEKAEAARAENEIGNAEKTPPKPDDSAG